MLLFGEELDYLLALRRDLHARLLSSCPQNLPFWHHVSRECFLPRRFKLASRGGFSGFWGVGSGSGVTLGSSWQDFATGRFFLNSSRNVFYSRTNLQVFSLRPVTNLVYTAMLRQRRQALCRRSLVQLLGRGLGSPTSLLERC